MFLVGACAGGPNRGGRGASSDRLAQQLRREIEQLRRRARHGTLRTLSSLSLALMVVADPLLLSFPNLTQLLKSSLQALRSDQTLRATVSV